MGPMRQKRTAASSREVTGADISGYFAGRRESGPVKELSKMAAPRGAARQTETHNHAAPTEEDALQQTPSPSGRWLGPRTPGKGDETDAPSPNSHSEAGDAEPSTATIADMLRAFPTREDLQAIISRLEWEHKLAIQEVKGEVEGLKSRMEQIELNQTFINHMEYRQTVDSKHLLEMTLKTEDLEDRSRRNNVRLRGVPEEIGATHLRDTVVTIFNLFLERDPKTPVEIDRVHRTMGPHKLKVGRSRDVLCKLHYFTTREQLLDKPGLANI